MMTGNSPKHAQIKWKEMNQCIPLLILSPLDLGKYGYNRYPDEKGTENCNGRSDLRIATRYSKPFMVDFRIT